MGKPYGKGKLTYANGSYYEGEFVNGKKHGKGVTYFTSDTFHKGYYKEGKSEGKCKLRCYLNLPATFYDNP
jgi:hypothetical protein